MTTPKTVLLCLITAIGFSQTTLQKTTQRIDVSKDVVVDLNTNYVEIELDTWNKNEVSIEAYLESEVLSKDDLAQALQAWNLNVDASSDYVKISSEGGRSLSLFADTDYDDVLKDLEFSLAELPEVPEVMVIPNIPNAPDFPAPPEMPEMPAFPELPELPEGINTIKFDHERYQKEGETYLEEWSKRYKNEGGKELQERMEAWARKFAETGYEEKIKAWSDAYAKAFEGKWSEEFGKEWAERMKTWGERYGAQVERRAQQIERQEQRRAMLLARRALREAEHAKRRKKLRGKHNAVVHKNAKTLILKSENNDKLKKVIKIKIPKKAKLNLNVRHGELKVASALYNPKGNIAHAFVIAEHIEGSDTSLNVSYSPLIINTWNLGTLTLNFVDKAQIKSVKHLVLNSKSSNVLVDTISDTAIIDGSFGDLTISNLEASFNNLNLVLENTDALINLPNQVDYNLYFKGNRSKFNTNPTLQKTVRVDNNGESSNRTIVVNAKFSNVIMN